MPFLAAAGALTAPAGARAAALTDVGVLGGFAAPSGAAVLDTDLDGRPDVAVADGSVVAVFRGQGDGTFLPAGAPPVSRGAPVRLAAGDLDSDGHPDLVVLDADGAVLPLLSRAGGLQAAPVVDLGPGDWGALAVGDIYNDGGDDVVAGDNAGGAVVVLRAAMNGSLGTPLTVLHAAAAHAIAITDLDGQRIDNDLVVADPGTEDDPLQLVHALVRRDDGSYGPAPASPLITGGIPDALAADGGQVVVADGGPANVFRAGVGGRLVAQAPFTGAPVSEVALADMNGDGTPDLIASGAHGAGFSVGVEPATPEGFQSDPAPVTAAREPYNLAAGDFSGDGRPDVVVPELDSGTFRLLRNSGEPRLQVAPSVLTFDEATRQQRGSVTITNAGTWTLTLGEPTVTGPDAAHFAISPCSLRGPLTVRAGDSCTLYVYVSVSRSGVHPAYAATLTIPSSAGTATVALTAAAEDTLPRVARLPLPGLPLAPRCVVPRLKGHTLTGATKRLRKHHCALGAVRRPKARAHGAHRRAPLVVATQAVKAGTRRPAGAKVGLRLAPRPARKHPGHR